MGGDWHDLGGALADDVAEPVALQPLARIDDAGERAWAADWIATLLARETVAITPELKEHLWSALTSLSSAPIAERTITGLSVLLQSNALKQALQPYTVAGPWGRLLDAETERLGEAEVQAFETEGLIGAGAAPTVLSYLFHRIEDRFDGRPTLLIDRRGLARARRQRLRRAAPRMAEDASQEERFRHFRHPVARRHRRFGDRAGDHRELPDAHLPAQRARARAADRGHLSALRTE